MLMILHRKQGINNSYNESSLLQHRMKYGLGLHTYIHTYKATDNTLEHSNFKSFTKKTSFHVKIMELRKDIFTNCTNSKLNYINHKNVQKGSSYLVLRNKREYKMLGSGITSPLLKKALTRISILKLAPVRMRSGVPAQIRTLCPKDTCLQRRSGILTNFPYAFLISPSTEIWSAHQILLT
jgi:hypothetical protein